MDPIPNRKNQNQNQDQDQDQEVKQSADSNQQNGDNHSQYNYDVVQVAVAGSWLKGLMPKKIFYDNTVSEEDSIVDLPVHAKPYKRSDKEAYYSWSQREIIKKVGRGERVFKMARVDYNQVKCELNGKHIKVMTRRVLSRSQLADDFDVISFDSNFSQSIKEQLAQHFSWQKLIVTNGTIQQQSCEGDRDTARTFLCGSIASKIFRNISDQWGALYDSQSVADIVSGYAPGVAFNEFLAMKKSELYPDAGAGFIVDPSKFSVIYSQMHKLALEYPEKNVLFVVMDDDAQRVMELEEFFEERPRLIPKKIHLQIVCVHQHKSSQHLKMFERKILVGEGEADRFYVNTVMEFLNQSFAGRKKLLQMPNDEEAKNAVYSNASVLFSLAQVGVKYNECYDFARIRQLGNRFILVLKSLLSVVDFDDSPSIFHFFYAEKLTVTFCDEFLSLSRRQREFVVNLIERKFQHIIPLVEFFNRPNDLFTTKKLSTYDDRLLCFALCILMKKFKAINRDMYFGLLQEDGKTIRKEYCRVFRYWHKLGFDLSNHQFYQLKEDALLARGFIAYVSSSILQKKFSKRINIFNCDKKGISEVLGSKKFLYALALWRRLWLQHCGVRIIQVDQSQWNEFVLYYNTLKSNEMVCEMLGWLAEMMSAQNSSIVVTYAIFKEIVTILDENSSNHARANSSEFFFKVYCLALARRLGQAGTIKQDLVDEVARAVNTNASPENCLDIFQKFSLFTNQVVILTQDSNSDSTTLQELPDMKAIYQQCFPSSNKKRLDSSEQSSVDSEQLVLARTYSFCGPLDSRSGVSQMADGDRERSADENIVLKK